MLPFCDAGGHIIESSISEMHLSLKISKPTQFISRMALSRKFATALVRPKAQAG
jgi:hypothetical protein